MLLGRDLPYTGRVLSGGITLGLALLGLGIMAWLAGFAWTAWDWPGVCALGAASAALAGLVAWFGVARAA